MIWTKAGRVARGKALMFGFLLVAVVTASFTVADSAHALSPLVVNSTGDLPDANNADNVCDFDLAADGEQCTLRAAISQANAFPGHDNITFAIPGDGPHFIAPASDLPSITQPVTIDGYTETLDETTPAAPNTATEGTNAKLRIELRGGNAGSGSTGLTILGSSPSKSEVRGLAINNFTQGIAVLENIDEEQPTDVKIEGNFIGTNVDGTDDQGNSDKGVVVADGSSNVIGGDTLEARNLISGNDGNGIEIDGEGKNRVEGNLIGTKANGTEPLGNGFSGVSLRFTSNNTVGDDDASDGATNAANTIAFNGSEGVGVIVGTGNRILSNSIFSNSSLGIDLGVDGVTPNDPKDPDAGANDLQNYPVLARRGVKTSSSTGTTTIKGKLNSTPNTTFTVRFFSNPLNSKEEGKTFLGEKTDVTTNGEGKAAFTFTSTQAAPVGQFVTATATDPSGNTSEFSVARKVRRFS